MSEKENQDTVREGYRAFISGDIEGFLALLADDVQWIMPRVPGVPFTGNLRGRAQVAEFFRALGDAEEVVEFTQDEFIVTGSRVAVIGRYVARVRATGRTVETPYAQFFTVVDRKIHAFQEIFDTAAVAEAYRTGKTAESDR
jgi:hypothetical protein